MATRGFKQRRGKRLLWLAVPLVLAAGVLLASWATSQTDPREEALALACKFLGRSREQVEVVRFHVEDHHATLALVETPSLPGKERPRSGLRNVTVNVVLDLQRRYVRSMSRPSDKWMVSARDRSVIPLAAAQESAEAFARAHFPRSWSEEFQLVYANPLPYSARSDTTVPPLAYMFNWKEMRGEASTGTSVSVSIAAGTGEVCSYSARLAPRDDPPEPRLTRAEAQERIEAMLKANNPPPIRVEVEDLDLVLSSALHPQGGPVWIADWRRWASAPEGYEGQTWNGEIPVLGGIIVLDALTGEVLEGPGKPRADTRGG